MEPFFFPPQVNSDTTRCWTWASNWLRHPKPHASPNLTPLPLPSYSKYQVKLRGVSKGGTSISFMFSLRNRDGQMTLMYAFLCFSMIFYAFSTPPRRSRCPQSFAFCFQCTPKRPHFLADGLGSELNEPSVEVATAFWCDLWQKTDFSTRIFYAKKVKIVRFGLISVKIHEFQEKPMEFNRIPIDFHRNP